MDAVEEVGDVLAGGLVELARRLVGDEQHRIVRQRPRDGDALHLAARELRRQMIRAIDQLHVLEQRARPRAARRRGDAGFGLRQLDILRCRQHRQQEESLKDEADARQPDAAARRLRQRRDIAVLEEDRSRRGRVDAADQVQQRRLAAARRSGDGDVLAGGDVKRHVAQRCHWTGRHREHTAHAARLDDQRRRHQPTTSRRSVAAIGSRDVSQTGYAAAAAAVMTNRTT